MSLVVALRDKKTGNFVLGAESQVTRGDCKYHGLKKVYKYETLGLAVGVVGDLRVMNLLFNNEELFKPLIKNDKIDREYLVKEFTKKLYEYLKEYQNDFVDRDNSGNARSILYYADIIIAYKNEAFHIFSDYGVLEIINYDTMGIGIEAATTCVEALDKFSDLDSHSIVENTIKIVSKNIVGIDSDVCIVSC